VTGDWRKLHNEELNTLKLNTDRVLRSNRMKRAGHMAIVGGNKYIQNFGRLI